MFISKDPQCSDRSCIFCSIQPFPEQYSEVIILLSAFPHLMGRGSCWDGKLDYTNRDGWFVWKWESYLEGRWMIRLLWFSYRFTPLAIVGAYGFHGGPRLGPHNTMTRQFSCSILHKILHVFNVESVGLPSPWVGRTVVTPCGPWIILIWSSTCREEWFCSLSDWVG